MSEPRRAPAAAPTEWAERGRAAWPELVVDDGRFGQFVAARIGGHDGESVAAGDLYVEDLYLACACLDGLPRALAAFDACHLATVPRHLTRIDRSPSFADEVCQRLRERLFVADGAEPPRMAAYSGRGPLGVWVKVAAVRLALNLRRNQREVPLGRGDEPIVDGNAELLLLRQRFRADFTAAFALAVAALAIDARQLLRLHFLDGVSLGELAALERVDKSTLSRRLQAAREALLRDTERYLCARLRLDDCEVLSLIRLMRSQFGDVSVARLLRANDAA
jgi:RNA polymerase sigma-70 factor, ECF subfamily